MQLRPFSLLVDVFRRFSNWCYVWRNMSVIYRRVSIIWVKHFDSKETDTLMFHKLFEFHNPSTFTIKHRLQSILQYISILSQFSFNHRKKNSIYLPLKLIPRQLKMSKCKLLSQTPTIREEEINYLVENLIETFTFTHAHICKQVRTQPNFWMLLQSLRRCSVEIVVLKISQNS